MNKHVYSDNTDWFVAESPEHAAALWATYMRDEIGEDQADYEGTSHFEQEPDDKLLTITTEDIGPVRKVTKTCAEWARTEPVCFLGSTEW